MAKPSSRNHIIAVATELFAERGLSVSLREVNEAAGLSAAAVHYHFKNKGALIDAVLRSRMRPKAEREGQLRQLATASKVTIDDIVRTLLAPLREVLSEDAIAGRQYARVIARVYAEQSEELPLLDEFLSPANALIAMLAQQRPDLSLLQCRLRYGFAVEAMLNTLSCVHFPSPFGGDEVADDMAMLFDELQQFLVAGLSAP